METKLKPFDLELAKAGKPVVTRSGETVTFGGYNKNANDNERIIGWIGDGCFWWYDDGCFWWYDDGRDGSGCSEDDLFMLPEKKTVWVNVYNDKHTKDYGYFTSRGYESKEFAQKEISSSYNGDYFIGTYPMEIDV